MSQRRDDEETNGGDGAGSDPRLNPDGVEKVLEMWDPVIQAVVDATRGDQDAIEALEEAFERIDASDEWRDLGVRLRRILAGDRDAAALLKGTDVVDGVILRGTLDALEDEHPAEASEAPDELEALDEFLGLVRYACSPDAPPTLSGQLASAAENMRDADGVTPATNALGRVLVAILEGDRDPDLSGLPEDHAEHVRLLLQKITQDEA